MPYFVTYMILDSSGIPFASGASIEESFVLPRSMDDIKRLADKMTDYQRSRKVIGPDHWLCVMGWSEMGD